MQRIFSNRLMIVGITVSAWLLISPTAPAMTPEPGFPVRTIPFADRLDAWEVVDKRHVVVSLSPSRSYLLTLNSSCHRLNGVSSLGVSSSNNTVYAGFDYVTAGGQRCAIKKINRISKAQKDALTKA